MSMDRRSFLSLGLGAAACSLAGMPAAAMTGVGASAQQTADALAGTRDDFVIDPIYMRQIVPYEGPGRPGTIVVRTKTRFVYLVLPDGQALRYGCGIGRDGFAWSGEATVARKAVWPAWYPPPEMRKRQPELPAMMAGGLKNPLGARALYLYKNGVDTLYRIHGTSEAWTIGQAVSSGCVRLMNDDIIDLYQRVPTGTRVIVI
ncbi:L,D-transpeptidase [Chelatococcus composti]|jgi:Uncharacterized protein conserved in bacteria|uniref:Lipoprotein-anchoring transpeptidase ErfK/SrfK n=1 Tax=Chelatococcus composti TaxID=1743235 RepID=A0A841KAY3_9HYPH|nr:L,D-transpeptidase [Chelatococcus composti]MBB6169657.1 lipoprotein-anchoring transpeptidase ErfK/SrfK [Chelatococcus composti]MBS7736816.1 L,D-transpeptidase family protein [Chelatococcus composti]GGG49343.1 hypothetical protein GCM10008026_33160 [Chelatococcus composti]